MKLTLYIAFLLFCFSGNYVSAQPAENLHQDFTGPIDNSINLPPRLHTTTYHYGRQNHCNGWYIGEYMMIGGGAVALGTGGVLLSNGNNNSFNDYQQHVFTTICGGGLLVFAIGAEIFRISWKYEGHWSIFSSAGTRNQLGIAYKF